MARHATVSSTFTSHGKEALGFYDNVDKIEVWRKKYNFPEGVESMLDTLNHQGYAGTCIASRAFYVAYVLSKEGYDAHVVTE